MQNSSSMKTTIKSTSYALLLLLFCRIGPAYAQNEKFTASVSSSAIAIGDQLQVTFSLNANGRNFHAPTFVDFTVLMGPSQSTQMQIVNGAVSQTISFTYVLQAVKEGTLKIGSAEIYVGNTKLTTNPITVTVTKGAPQPQTQKGQQGNQQGNDAVYGGKNVFIVATVNQSNPYRGEGICVTYKLYTKVSIVNYATEKLPSLSGFWSSDIAIQPQTPFHEENYNGVSYRAAEIKKAIIFPQRSGTLTIDPMEAEVIARVQMKKQKSNDPFDQFFNDPFFNNPIFNNSVQDIKLKLKSEPIKINVRDLPPNSPASFNGAVGTFNYEVALDKKETKANEPVTLKIKITGKGNLKLIDAPKISFPADFEVYDPKENLSINTTAAGVTGSKTFEYLIIPRNSGEFKIPATPFSYFDLEKKKYEEHSGPELTLKVEHGTESATTIISGVNKSDVQLLGKDIHFIKTKEPDFSLNEKPIFRTPVFYGVVGFPAIAFLWLLIFTRRKREREANSGLVKSRGANKVAMKRLSAARKFLDGGKKDEFLDEMFRALWGFVSDKLRIPVSELTKETVSHALSNKKVSEEVINEFIGTIGNCEFARFAGTSDGANQELYDKGISVISKLENFIR